MTTSHYDEGIQFRNTLDLEYHNIRIYRNPRAQMFWSIHWEDEAPEPKEAKRIVVEQVRGS